MEQKQEELRTPLVSVLVPVYNTETYLERCLESILAQTYQNFEVILCDDGSTDQSGMICDRYAEHYAQVRVIHKENEGLLRTRRRLFHEAKGEYVQCVDSDDWVASNLLEEAVKAGEKAQCDVVMFGYMQVDDDGTELRRGTDLYPDGMVFERESRKALCRDFAVTVKLNHLWDKLIRRELIRKDEEEMDEIYQENINGEDKLQLVAVFRRAKRFCYLAQPLYYYRMSTTGMGRNYQLKYLRDLEEVSWRVLAFMKKEDLFDDDSMRAFYMRYCRSMTVLVSDLVLSEKYSEREITAACRDAQNSILYHTAQLWTESIEGSVWMKFLFWLFMGHNFVLMQRVILLRKHWKEKRKR